MSAMSIDARTEEGERFTIEVVWGIPRPGDLVERSKPDFSEALYEVVRVRWKVTGYPSLLLRPVHAPHK